MQIWAEQALMAMVVGSMISSVIAGPVFAVMFRKEREAYACSHQALEHLGPDQKLRMLACVHGARGAPGMLSLVELLASKPRAQPTIHVLHLFDVARKHVGPKHYHKRIQLDNDDKHIDRRNDAATQVNWAVDVFTCATGLVIRQIDTADRGTTVNAKAINRWTEDVRAGLLLIPYHKEQHYDGKMVCPRQDRRQLILEVLERAPCTTGILADRPFRSGGTSFQLPAKISASEEISRNPGNQTAGTHVAAVFLGGPDDREAVAFACRLAKNDTVSLTVIRFVLRGEHDLAEDRRPSASADHIDGEVLSIVIHDDADAGVGVVGDDPDEDCMSAFHRAYVAKELAAYVEKAVGGPMDMVAALRGMAGAYALVVVGRGGQQPAELVVGLEGWAECAEVGPVGEILASDESLEMGSVIIMQQKTVPPPFHLDLPVAI